MVLVLPFKSEKFYNYIIVYKCNFFIFPHTTPSTPKTVPHQLPFPSFPHTIPPNDPQPNEPTQPDKAFYTVLQTQTALSFFGTLHMNKIGDKLRILRNRQGLTTKELGKILGISSSYVVRIENGPRRPSIDVVADIARFFNVSADLLIMDELELDD